MILPYFCPKYFIMGKNIDIMVIDDETLVRLGIKFSLLTLAPDIHVVAEAGDVATAKVLLKGELHFDMVLLDLQLPDGNGLDLARLIRQTHPDVKILVVSMETSEDILQSLFNIGIDGFISKQAGDEELVSAICSVAEGFEFYGDDVAHLIHAVQTSLRWKEPNFTEREMEIVRLCAKGLTAKQIADQLCLSARTIETHKHNIFQKMGFGTTAELIHYAFQYGLVKM